MQELVSPAQSEKLVLAAACLLLLAASIYGYKTAGRRGLVAGLVGPLAWVLWQGHKYVTRYDPRTGYFGLQSVAVLLAEVVAFIMIGALLARLWDAITAKAAEEAARDRGG